jgi:hypothetical protein
MVNWLNVSVDRWQYEQREMYKLWTGKLGERTELQKMRHLD